MWGVSVGCGFRVWVRGVGCGDWGVQDLLSVSV